jgi:hypothetical protein
MNALSFERIPNSPYALGMICEFVARFAPFNDYEFGLMTKTLLYQLETGSHLIVGVDDRIVGYVGWIRTTRAIAEAWFDRDAKLEPAYENVDAVAVTVLAQTEYPLLSVFACLISRSKDPQCMEAAFHRRPARCETDRAQEGGRRMKAYHDKLLVPFGDKAATMVARVWQPDESRGSVFCIPAFESNGSDFDYLAQLLVRSSFTVVAPDLIGRGKSTLVARPRAIHHRDQHAMPAGAVALCGQGQSFHRNILGRRNPHVLSLPFRRQA